MTTYLQTPDPNVILVQPRSMTASPRNSVSDWSREETVNNGVISCPFASNGCHKIGTQQEVKLHLRDDRILHLVLLCQTVKKLRDNDELTEKDYEGLHFLYDKMLRASAVLNKYSTQTVMKIQNVNKTIQKAKHENHRLIFGDAFESHRYGYRLLPIAVPFGDGDAVREYFSIFISIMKGDYDGILAWPFDCPIRFTAVARTGEQSIERLLLPTDIENKDIALIKPTGQRNPSFGVLNFIPLAEIDRFVIADEIYIKIEVDITEMKRKSRKVNYEQCN